MKQEIKDFLSEYCKGKGWGTDTNTLREVLTEGKEVYSEVTNSRRHWDDLWKVVEIDGRYFGYEYAHTTGDMSIHEKGWEFDDSSVMEVFKKTKVVEITTYE